MRQPCLSILFHSGARNYMEHQLLEVLPALRRCSRRHERPRCRHRDTGVVYFLIIETSRSCDRETDISNPHSPSVDRHSDGRSSGWKFTIDNWTKRPEMASASERMDGRCTHSKDGEFKERSARILSER